VLRYRDKKVVGVFVRFRAPLQSHNVSYFSPFVTGVFLECYGFESVEGIIEALRYEW
jgi:hypothetical protein